MIYSDLFLRCTQLKHVLTFWTSMTKGRKEEVVSSVIRGGATNCWCTFACLASSTPGFLSSSSTRCRCRRLYGVLKFLMNASVVGNNFLKVELKVKCVDQHCSQ